MDADKKVRTKYNRECSEFLDKTTIEELVKVRIQIKQVIKVIKVMFLLKAGFEPTPFRS